MSVHNLKIERMMPDDVYIGRAGKGLDGYFGNPFMLGSESREVVLDRYREWAKDRIYRDPEFRARVKALHGKRLFCFCAPLGCHGDILETLARKENQ